MKRKIRVFRIWRAGRLSLCKAMRLKEMGRLVKELCRTYNLPTPYIGMCGDNILIALNIYCIGLLINKIKGENFMTAQEAFKLSKEPGEKNNFESVLKAIEVAACKGKYYMTIDKHDISETTRNKLTELGYSLTDKWEGRTMAHYEISWDRVADKPPLEANLYNKMFPDYLQKSLTESYQSVAKINDTLSFLVRVMRQKSIKIRNPADVNEYEIIVGEGEHYFGKTIHDAVNNIKNSYAEKYLNR